MLHSVLTRYRWIALGLLLAAPWLGCGSSEAGDDLDGPVGPADCPAQPPAVAQCDGFGCTIPAGCFVQGLASDDPCLGPDLPLQRTVTITRGFEMPSTEYVRGNAPWTGPGPEPACKDRCPVVVGSWTAAAAGCNAVSRARGLPECYRCAERVFDDAPTPVFVCDGGPREAFLGCQGYRLPTAAEWEYAALAGARTPLPNGTPSVCQGGADPLADTLAWYMYNAEGTLHAVGLKQPNAWGLHDMLGNAAEWVEDVSQPTARAEEMLSQLGHGQTGGDLQKFLADYRAELRRALTTPVIDPLARPHQNTLMSWSARQARGGSINTEVAGLRPAVSRSVSTPLTFRCVRTLAP